MNLKQQSIRGFFILSQIALFGSAADAQDATWVGTTNDWNLSGNWSPAAQPSGTAIFGPNGAVTSITFSAAATSIGTMQFNSLGLNYTFTLGAFPMPQTLTIGGTGISGPSANVVLNVSAYLTNKMTLQFSGASGAGSATINNRSSTVEFSGTSSAQSAIISSSYGITRFKDSATAGNAMITVSDQSCCSSPTGNGLQFYNTSTAGNANIVTTGAGALAAFHDSSTAGAATITSLDFSGVKFFDTSSAGNASLAGSSSEQVVIPPTGDVVSGPTNGIGFYNSSSAGSANIGRSSGITFSDTSSAGSATILNDETDSLVFGDYSTAANATITTTTSGYQTTFLDHSNGGEARFINVGNAVLNFSTTSGLQNDNKITAGSIEGTGIVFLGINQLTVGGNNLSTTFSGQILGGGWFGGSGGSLIKVGAGTMILAGANTYSGGTTIDGGVLQFNQPAAIAGAGPNVLVNPGGIAAAGYPIDQAFISRIAPASQGVIALTTNSTNNLNFGAAGLMQVSLGAIGNVTYGGTLTTGGGVFRLGGSGGSLTLTSQLLGPAMLLINPSGSTDMITLDAANSYSGATQVAGGTLLIGDANSPAASIAGPISVANGATLGGRGTINGSVTSSGNVQPGGSIGVLTITGNYSQTSSGTLTVQITPNAAAGPGVGYSQLSVGGNVSLGGALAILNTPGSYTLGSRYTLVTASGGRSGTFDAVSYSSTFASYILPVVSYDPNDVYLSLVPAPGPSGQPLIFNGGQQVPDTLTAMVHSAEGVADTVLDDVCSPDSQRLLSAGRVCVTEPLATGYQSEVWMRGLGGFGSISGSGARSSFGNHYGGLLIGAGISHGGFAVGAGGGYLATGLNFSDGSSASQNAGVGLVYGRYMQGPLWAGIVAAYGGGQVDGSRALPPTGLTATGNRSGQFAVVQGRVAYDLPVGPFTVEPRANLAYLHAGQASFTETGASLLNLSYPSTNTDVVEGRLTVRAMQRFTVGGWSLSPWVEGGVQQIFSGLSRNVFVTDAAFDTTISGVSVAPTAGMVGIGLDATATPTLDLFARYQGLLSSNQAENTFSVGLLMRF